MAVSCQWTSWEGMTTNQTPVNSAKFRPTSVTGARSSLSEWPGSSGSSGKASWWRGTWSRGCRWQFGDTRATSWNARTNRCDAACGASQACLDRSLPVHCRLLCCKGSADSRCVDTEGNGRLARGLTTGSEDRRGLWFRCNSRGTWRGLDGRRTTREGLRRGARRLGLTKKSCSQTTCFHILRAFVIRCKNLMRTRTRSGAQRRSTTHRRGQGGTHKIGHIVSFVLRSGVPNKILFPPKYRLAMPLVQR